MGESQFAEKAHIALEVLVGLSERSTDGRLRDAIALVRSSLWDEIEEGALWCCAACRAEGWRCSASCGRPCCVQEVTEGSLAERTTSTSPARAGGLEVPEAQAQTTVPASPPRDEIDAVHVGFRYQDGEVLSPEREAQSRTEEIPVVVLDSDDGEWLTLAEVHAADTDLCGEHHWLDRPESDTRECRICGEEVFGG